MRRKAVWALALLCVVLPIHGTSASLHTWEGWAAALKNERRVVSFDLPGFGLTGPSAGGDYSIAAYTRFVLDLLDALKIDRCVRDQRRDPQRRDRRRIGPWLELPEAPHQRLAVAFAQGQLVVAIAAATAVRQAISPPRAFARDIAGSTLVVFDDLGHVPHEEDPARTVAEVKRFLGIAPGV